MGGIVIIPAMGASQRFVDKGYHAPKYLLSYHRREEKDISRLGKSGLEQIIETIPEDWMVRVVCPSKMAKSVGKILGDRGLPLILDQVTEGQSDTIRLALSRMGSLLDDPIMIHNCDVMLDPNDVSTIASNLGTMVALHWDATNGDSFSYVDDRDSPTWFAEKMRITGWAQTGLWKFAQGRDLLGAIESQISQKLKAKNGEYYLSAALNLLPGTKWGWVVPDGWADWGTPEAARRTGWEITE